MLVDNDAHQRETITKWPIWLSLSMCWIGNSSNMADLQRWAKPNVSTLVELTRTWSWKSRIVAIFLLFLTLWHVLTYKQADATLASLSILKYEALKWPHRVIRGSKIKSASILFKKYVRSSALTQEFQKCNYFSNATHGSDVRCCKRSKVSIQIVQGSKN